MWEGFYTLLQPPPSMRRERYAHRFVHFGKHLSRTAAIGQAWQSIRQTRTEGGERTAENYVKMFWIVKPDGRTEKSHCAASGRRRRGGGGRGRGSGSRTYGRGGTPYCLSLSSPTLRWSLRTVNNTQHIHTTETAKKRATEWPRHRVRTAINHTGSADVFYTCLLTTTAFTCLSTHSVYN